MAVSQSLPAELVLDVHVQPRASKDELVGYHGDRLKIRIKAPPVDGKANQYLIGFLAEVFKVSKRDILLMSGESSREKRFKILSPQAIPDIIQIGTCTRLA
jgi:uncharacterized protein (TIGR00251 family)